MIDVGAGEPTKARLAGPCTDDICLFAMSLITRKEHWGKKYRAHYKLLYSGLSTPMQWVSCDIQVYDTILSKPNDKR
jgi:hypothetical protein